MCQHHWLCGDTTREGTPAVCKWCGDETTIPYWWQPFNPNSPVLDEEFKEDIRVAEEAMR